MVIHTNGWKAERDRVYLLNRYHGLIHEFQVKPIAPHQLARLTNHQLDRLCRDTFAQIPAKAKRWFAEKTGKVPRSGEFRVRWFIRDLFHPAKKAKPQATKPSGVPFVNA